MNSGCGFRGEIREPLIARGKGHGTLGSQPILIAIVAPSCCYGIDRYQLIRIMPSTVDELNRALAGLLRVRGNLNSAELARGTEWWKSHT